MSIPIALSVFFLILNSLIDTAWVSGLGPQALAAVGFITPLSMALAGFGTGLGAGANSVISRYLGGDNLKRANNSATHSVVLGLGFGISGASLATTLSQTIFGLCPMVYWLFIKKR